MNSIQVNNFTLFYKGNIELLKRPKIAIVGSRKASKYSKEITYLLSSKLSQKFTIISGGALGIDTQAHKGAFPNTIFVSPSSLDIIYPKANEHLIKNIFKDGLALSEYEKNFRPYKYTFLKRNEIIISLADIVIIPEASLKSGTINSFNIAKKLNKKIYTIPQRLNESEGTRMMALNNEAEVIWDIDLFCKSLGIEDNKKVISLNEALKIYKDKLYEMELNNEVEIKNAKVYFK